jgi:sugar lactone lactonase YvrE
VPDTVDDPARASGATARLLRPNDDVATALSDLRRGARVVVQAGATVREVTLLDDIPLGHKFAVRALAHGVRVRKYGEFIGRATRAIAPGAWVHEHNLETTAHPGCRREHGVSWQDAVEPANVVRVFGATRCTVGESPLFDAYNGAFYWIDVRETPAIHRLDVSTGAEARWPLDEDIGSIALIDGAANGHRLLAGLRSGFAVFDCTTASMTPLVDPEAHLPHTRMNDGKCDAAGRFWCGSMQPEAGTADGSLYVLDGNLACRKVLDDLVIPNGMTWSLDHRIMYLADTRRGCIWSFDFDLASGALGERRLFADLGAMPGGPDGATLDAQGFLWSAQFDGGCLVRYAPDGRVDRVVRLPVTKPSSCSFGGPDFRELYVTTATLRMTEEQVRAEPDAGRVLVLDAGVRGMPPSKFIPGTNCKFIPGTDFP